MDHTERDNQVPRTRKQTVVFVRHGIAKHNVIDPLTGRTPDLEDPKLLDPPLLRDGKFQAIDMGERLKLWWTNGRRRHGEAAAAVQLVITSPLTRCLQTATLAFLPGDIYCDDDDHHMEPTIVCTESIREAYGIHYPDRRRKKSLLVSRWPWVHFDSEMCEDDDWRQDRRESYNDVQGRVNTFLSKLVKRPEENVVVVSHGVWIECCFRFHCPSALSNGDRVRNCDMFAAECLSLDGYFHSLRNVRRIE